MESSLCIPLPVSNHGKDVCIRKSLKDAQARCVEAAKHVDVVGGRSKRLQEELKLRGGNLFDVIDFGAVQTREDEQTEEEREDSKKKFTVAFRGALQAAAKCREGGVVFFPPGRWVSAPVLIEGVSKVTLFLSHGATLKASDDLEDWPLIPFLPSYGQGRDHPGPRHASFLQVTNCRDVRITGDGGEGCVLDGNGQKWWDRRLSKEEKHTRGHLIEFLSCVDVTVSFVHLQNSPFWTLHPVYCDGVHIHDMSISSPLYHAPNTDGIDPDSSWNVVIERCRITTCDDCIAIKSGYDHHGYRFGRPAKNIVIRNCELSSRRCAAVCLGSEMSGGIENVMVHSNKVFDSCQGIHFKSAAGRGGWVSHVTVSDCSFKDVAVGIRLNSFYRGHPHDGYDPQALPQISGLVFRRLRISATKIGLEAEGLWAAPFERLFLDNVVIAEHQGESAAGVLEAGHPHGGTVAASAGPFVPFKGRNVGGLQRCVIAPAAALSDSCSDSSPCRLAASPSDRKTQTGSAPSTPSSALESVSETAAATAFPRNLSFSLEEAETDCAQIEKGGKEKRGCSKNGRSFWRHTGDVMPEIGGLFEKNNLKELTSAELADTRAVLGRFLLLSDQVRLAIRASERVCECSTPAAWCRQRVQRIEEREERRRIQAKPLASQSKDEIEAPTKSTVAPATTAVEEDERERRDGWTTEVELPSDDDRLNAGEEDETEDMADQALMGDDLETEDMKDDDNNHSFNHPCTEKMSSHVVGLLGADQDGETEKAEMPSLFLQPPLTSRDQQTSASPRPPCTPLSTATPKKNKEVTGGSDQVTLPCRSLSLRRAKCSLDFGVGDGADSGCCLKEDGGAAGGKDELYPTARRSGRGLTMFRLASFPCPPSYKSSASSSSHFLQPPVEFEEDRLMAPWKATTALSLTRAASAASRMLTHGGGKSAREERRGAHRQNLIPSAAALIGGPADHLPTSLAVRRSETANERGHDRPRHSPVDRHRHQSPSSRVYSTRILPRLSLSSLSCSSTDSDSECTTESETETRPHQEIYLPPSPSQCGGGDSSSSSSRKKEKERSFPYPHRGPFSSLQLQTQQPTLLPVSPHRGVSVPNSQENDQQRPPPLSEGLCTFPSEDPAGDCEEVTSVVPLPSPSRASSRGSRGTGGLRGRERDERGNVRRRERKRANRKRTASHGPGILARWTNSGTSAILKTNADSAAVERVLEVQENMTPTPLSPHNFEH